MLPVTSNPDGTAPSNGPAVLSGPNSYQLVWCPTWRLQEISLNKENSRNDITCYMRGLKEHISISTNNSTSWKWRRICFTVKGLKSQLSIASNVDHLFTSQGYVRLIVQHWNDDMGNSINSILFEGTANVDWNDVMTAKTSSTRVKVMYDKTRVINSGSEGVMRDYKIWHPMNKNLVYDDDESGPNNEITSGYSTIGRQGMGDYYVIDYIRANSTSSSLDTMTFGPEATLYWHEK